MRVHALLVACAMSVSMAAACGDASSSDDGAGPGGQTPPSNVDPLGPSAEGVVYRLDDAPTDPGGTVSKLVLGPDAIYLVGLPGARVRAVPKGGGAARELAALPNAEDASTYTRGLAFRSGHLHWLAEAAKKDAPTGAVTWMLADVDVASGTTAIVTTSPPFRSSLVARASGALCGEVDPNAETVSIACLDGAGEVTTWTEPETKRGLVGLAVRGETLYVATVASGEPAKTTLYAFDGALSAPPKVVDVDGEGVAIAATETGARLLVRTQPRQSDEGIVTFGQTLVDVVEGAAPVATPTGGRFTAIQGVIGPTTLLRENAAISPSMGDSGSYGGDASFARFGPAGLQGIHVEAWRGTELVSDGTWAWIGLSSMQCVEQGSCYKSSCSCNRYERHDRIERVRVP